MQKDLAATPQDRSLFSFMEGVPAGSVAFIQKEVTARYRVFREIIRRLSETDRLVTALVDECGSVSREDPDQFVFRDDADPVLVDRAAVFIRKNLRAMLDSSAWSLAQVSAKFRQSFLASTRFNAYERGQMASWPVQQDHLFKADWVDEIAERRHCRVRDDQLEVTTSLVARRFQQGRQPRQRQRGQRRQSGGRWDSSRPGRAWRSRSRSRSPRQSSRGRGRGGRGCLLYTSPSPRDGATSRMPSSA